MAYNRGYRKKNYGSRSKRSQYSEMEKTAFMMGRVQAELQKGDPKISNSFVNGMNSVK